MQIDPMTVPPQSRETIAAFHRGYEVAITACILVVQNMPPGERTAREVIARMRDLIIQPVPRAES